MEVFDDALSRHLQPLQRSFGRCKLVRFDAEALLRAMVFNRLCDATSKLGPDEATRKMYAFFVLGLLEEAGLAPERLEDMSSHYVRTLGQWLGNLDAHAAQMRAVGDLVLVSVYDPVPITAPAPF